MNLPLTPTEQQASLVARIDRELERGVPALRAIGNVAAELRVDPDVIEDLFLKFKVAEQRREREAELV